MGFVASKWISLALSLLSFVHAAPRNPSLSRNLGFGLKPSRHDAPPLQSSAQEQPHTADDPFSSALDHDAKDHWETPESSDTWDAAQEHPSPSTSLAGEDVVMQSNLLQVPCGLQQQHEEDFDTKISPVAAFVDTGAQVTVLSKRAAARAGLLHLLDHRYAGHATGVGQCRVLGRIPAKTLLIHMGDALVEGPAITVLESTGTDGVDLLLGLDFLRDHHAILSLYEEEMKLFCDSNTPVIIPFVRPRRNSPQSRQQHAKNTKRKPPQPSQGPYLFEHEQETPSPSSSSSFDQLKRQESSYHHENTHEQRPDQDEELEESCLSDDYYGEEDFHEKVDLSGV